LAALPLELNLRLESFSVALGLLAPEGPDKRVPSSYIKAKAPFASGLIRFSKEYEVKISDYRLAIKSLSFVVLLAVGLMPIATPAQTQIKLHSNKYSPMDDVRLGRQAAAEAEQQFPLLGDRDVDAYVERVGERLVAAIPPEFQHHEFRYYFKVINASDINAFALPGGPMYVNRGMIQAARTEGEVAGVMAHELSHVALRHGTAQATKAQKYAIGAGVLGVVASILAGPAVGQLAELPVGAYFLKFSREYETEADLLGARIMANAGYDPHDLANMFQTIQAQGGGGGGFLSDHPSSKDRFARINQEAQSLKVNTAMTRDNREFFGIREQLKSYPPAQTMAQIERSGQRYPTQGNRYPNQYPNQGNQYPNQYPNRNPNQYPNGNQTGYPANGRVAYPSSRYRTYNEDSFSVAVPDNWRELNEQGTLWFAPNGAYNSGANGQTVFTHAVNLGAVQTNRQNLAQATDEFVNSLQRSNSNLRANTGYQRMDVAGRTGLFLTLNNVNAATGQAEVVNITTTQLRDGRLFYMIAISPRNEYSTYQSTFQAILRSVQLND
jgi:Zn-dependent protease with chaperone function